MNYKSPPCVRYGFHQINWKTTTSETNTNEDWHYFIITKLEIKYLTLIQCYVLLGLWSKHPCSFFNSACSRHHRQLVWVQTGVVEEDHRMIQQECVVLVHELLVDTAQTTVIKIVCNNINQVDLVMTEELRLGILGPNINSGWVDSLEESSLWCDRHKISYMMALLTLGNILLLIDSTLRVNFNLFRQCRLCGPLPYSHKFMF